MGSRSTSPAWSTSGASPVSTPLIAFAFVLIDGYDISALGFAVPELVKTWNVTDRSALGPVLTASLVGMLFGAPLLAAPGDRFGRKRRSSVPVSFSVPAARDSVRNRRGGLSSHSSISRGFKVLAWGSVQC
jgi:MFS family permease